MDTVAFGLGKEGYFPGFFYGTAGCAYIMAALYEVCREERFLKLARQGADYIKYIADKNDKKNAALVRYNDPYKNNLFYLGLCQGPVGTSRLFYKLYKITGEAEYKDWIIKLTNGILEAGAPQKHSSGYWHTYCYCCGSAGMLEHFLHIYDMTGEEQYLKAATESTEVLLRDSYEENGKRRWYTAWNRHLPGEVSAFTGLYVGTAGCASALLAYYNHQTEHKNLPEYIEDPYL
jgi:lantibiotic modifying enzyme